MDFGFELQADLHNICMLIFGRVRDSSTTDWGTMSELKVTSWENLCCFLTGGKYVISAFST